MGKKLEPKSPGGEGSDDDEPRQQTERHEAIGKRKLEHRNVIMAQRAHRERVKLLEAIGQQQGAERRRNGECGDDGADDGVSIKVAIGAKMCPSMPDRVNRGTKPVTMMRAENNTARSTSLIASAMAASLQVSRPGPAGPRTGGRGAPAPLRRGV